MSLCKYVEPGRCSVGIVSFHLPSASPFLALGIATVLTVEPHLLYPVAHDLAHTTATFACLHRSVISIETLR